MAAPTQREPSQVIVHCAFSELTPKNNVLITIAQLLKYKENPFISLFFVRKSSKIGFFVDFPNFSVKSDPYFNVSFILF
jgi:hypothetical protein